MNDAPKISPAMIEIYDEYTHLTLDRRGFMEKLTKLAGSGRGGGGTGSGPRQQLRQGRSGHGG
jgi:hypothetical protein